MYRVELKGIGVSPLLLSWEVPNVPCGVESREADVVFTISQFQVPNVPCGVESTTFSKASPKGFRFLMYRVELKASSLTPNWKTMSRS